MSNPSPHPTLQTALDFDDADLQANRRGQLTARQRNRVFVRPRVIYRSLALITLFIGSISAMLILAVLMNTDVSPVSVVLALAGEVITVALGYWTWTLRRQYETYLEPGRVHAISGPVNCYELKVRLSNEAARVLFYVRVDDLEFEVNAAALVAFTDGQDYTLHYIPQPLTLLSGERA
jgi:hypothetical protein